MQIDRLDISEIMSQVVIHGDTIYLSGQVSSDADDVAGQTLGVLEKIDAQLAKVGSQKTRLLSATIYLADISTFTEMNEVWKKWVPVGACPARTTVEAKLARPEFLVEITVIASR